MENAVDALHMAAAVLIFVLALSISINAFGQARQTSQMLVEYNDRELEYTYVEENTDEAGNVLTERIVGIESVIPTIYKAYRENYKIVFDVSNSKTLTTIGEDDGLFRKRDNATGDLIPNYEIDVDTDDWALAGDEQKLEFLMAILYGNKIDNFTDLETKFQSSSGIYLNKEGLYDKIKSVRLKENIGIYYQEEAGIETDDSDMETSGSSVPDANKTEKRVITYTVI